MVHIARPVEVEQVIERTPRVALCPRCGASCPLHERVVMHRMAGVLQGPAQQQTAIAGAYLCRACPKGQQWFRLHVPGFDPKRRYTPATQRALTALARHYNLSFLAAADFGRNYLHLEELHHSTIQRWLEEEADDFNYQNHLSQARDCFSGQLAIDEVYDGHFHILKVTDPINDIEITSWLGLNSPDADDIRALLTELREAGFLPTLVVTDGSTLYPGPLAEIWPNAVHQLCIFHFLQGALKTLTKAFWSAYRSLPTPKKRKRGRPKKKGRPREDVRKKENQQKVRAVRYLLFARDGRDEKGRPLLTEEERATLEEAMKLCPSLHVLRRFVCDLYELFGPTTDSLQEAEALCTRLCEDTSYKKDAAMACVMARLSDEENWKRLTRYHHFEGAEKTSNHVERSNREHRRRQRSHYRLRTIRSLWVLLDLTLMNVQWPKKPRRLRRKQPSPQETQEVLPNAA